MYFPLQFIFPYACETFCSLETPSTSRSVTNVLPFVSNYVSIIGTFYWSDDFQLLTRSLFCDLISH